LFSGTELPAEARGGVCMFDRRVEQRFSSDLHDKRQSGIHLAVILAVFANFGNITKSDTPAPDSVLVLVAATTSAVVSPCLCTPLTSHLPQYRYHDMVEMMRYTETKTVPRKRNRQRVQLESPNRDHGLSNTQPHTDSQCLILILLGSSEDTRPHISMAMAARA